MPKLTFIKSTSEFLDISSYFHNWCESMPVIIKYEGYDIKNRQD